MGPLDLVNLTGLMQLTRGRPALAIGLIDGPVALDHPHLAADNVRAILPNGRVPSVTPGELPAAIIDTVQPGARVINLSATLAQPSLKDEWELESPMLSSDYLLAPVFFVREAIQNVRSKA